MHLSSTLRFLRALALLGVLVVSFSQSASAQRVALSTDAVDWILCSPNLGIEARLSRRVTLGVNMAGNPFKTVFGKDDLRLSNFRVEPFVRYWFNRPMARNFVGINLLGGAYDLRYNKRCYTGDIFGAGIHYGYALVLGGQWNVTFSGGIGIGYVRGFDYKSSEDQPAAINTSKVIPLPDLSISFSYIFK